MINKTGLVPKNNNRTPFLIMKIVIYVIELLKTNSNPKHTTILIPIKSKNHGIPNQRRINK